jgi:hypothetical protein
MTSALLAGTLCLLLQAAAADPPASDPAVAAAAAPGAVPAAAFEVMFRKFTSSANEYAPYYSWDALIGMRIALLQRGAGAVTFGGRIQAVGTQNFGSRVGVGGTAYLLSIDYVHRYSEDVRLSAGITHLSSHLTRDLDQKIEEERRRGAAIPVVADPGEYNVLFVGGQRRFAALRFAPEIEVIVAPVNFRFGGGRHGHVRPVYLGTLWTVWRGHRLSVLAETQHELGTNAFHHFSLLLERESSSASGGRVQLFLSAAPGDTLHVSPNVGGLRDGLAVGVRFAFPR